MLLRDYLVGLFEHRKIFAVLLAVSMVLSAVKVKRSESYTAQIVIKYIDPDAENGISENGKTINPYEINSPLVVKNAITVLGLKNINIDAVCSSIVVSPIIPTAENEKYASWIEKFSDYSNTEEAKKNTVYYSVKYTSSEGKDYAKRMLSAIISQYRLFYVENYTGNYDITNLSGEVAMQYDYYDTADLLRKKISSNIRYLNSVVSAGTDYRSPKTGYSLADIASEYQMLSVQDLSVAERMIVENGIAKDPWYLINHLQNKMTDASYDIDLYTKQAETQKDLMTIYSEKNKQYLWTDGGSGSDSSESAQVRENIERNANYAPNKSVYDQLVLDYVGYRTNALNTEIDRKHYESDVAGFGSGSTDNALQKELEARLQSTCDKFNALYEITKETLMDYNTYQAAQSIACVSGVVAHKTENTIFYYVVGAVLAVMMGFLICGVLVYFKGQESDANDESAEKEKKEKAEGVSEA